MLTLQPIRAVCLILMTVFLSGCETFRSEGRAASILDASKPAARAHRDALLTDDLSEIRRTGGLLLSGLTCWWADCSQP